MSGHDGTPDGLPHGIDPSASEEAEASLDGAAHTLLDALEGHGSDASVRRACHAFQDAWNRAGRTPRLTLDGLYGQNTRSALSAVLGTPTAQLPALRSTRSTSSPTGPTTTQTTSSPDDARSPRLPAETETTRETRATSTRPRNPQPSYLPTAVALAVWTHDARASDATASRMLSRLNTNAEYLYARTRTAATSGLHGPVMLGAIPDAPTDESVEAWAAQVWAGVQDGSTAAVRELERKAQGLISQGQAALVSVRRALDSETDTAIREALTILENTLTAILRPAARAVRASGLSGGLLVVGGIVLLTMLPGGRRAA